jgi:hypothetical protein
VPVTGWRFERRWIVGVRRGEWWIGVRRSFSTDATEVNIFGLTILIPDEGTPLRRQSVRS